LFLNSFLPLLGGNGLALFEGGARVAQTRQASAEVTRLTVEREAAAERIEQRVRSALHVMGASYASIDLSEDASAAAKSNFDLVSDAYARGAVTILDLLDAQNAFLVAELGAADAVYDFLVDLMEVQRAIGSFSFVITAEERELFLQRMDEYFEQNQP
jgi:outer membrane protein TolC